MAKFASLPIASGVFTTVSASDTVPTGLKVVTSVLVTPADAPVQTATSFTGDIGDQSAAPVAGSFLLKSWMPTSVGSTLPVAATTFGKRVNWWAWGN